MRLTILMLVVLVTVATDISTGQKINFSLYDLENRQRSFAELKGEKLTVIDFWATWCRPCLRAVPELNDIYDTYREKGVSVIGINCDGPRSVSKVIPLSRSLQIRYHILKDMNADVMKRLNLSAFPTLLIADDDGSILWVHEGFIPGDEVIIKQQIEKYLDE
ncbi:MAG: TlpA disulfide reductase family protein [Bacteroidales bacterium]